jgi:hypothetical protein
MIRRVLVLFVVLLIFGGCQRQSTPLVTSDYANWSSTTTEVLNYPIPGHEENLRRIFINETGKGVSTEMRVNRLFHSYPENTVIIKEVYDGFTPDDDDDPVRLLVMIKNSQHSQSRGGWVWISKDVSSGDEQIIDYQFCFDCHGDANERHPYGDGNPRAEFRDYVYFPYTLE